VEGKSSLARLGLAIHVTAPTIHGGFSGNIQLEVINYGPLPIKLRPGMKICQLIFEQTLGVPEKLYQGQFKGQAPA
jgi:dCTP deaminase